MTPILLAGYDAPDSPALAHPRTLSTTLDPFKAYIIHTAMYNFIASTAYTRIAHDLDPKYPPVACILYHIFPWAYPAYSTRIKFL